ncbi:MAG: GNAT family N-acetyltransferase [Sphaerochaeta sp.]|nr:GNAT family N-acetyltransferase [Sphaerochaeta sp.]
MVVVNSLAEVGIDHLLEAFNDAFSDYDVPMQMDKTQLVRHMHTNGCSLDDSVGLFDEERLVGFLLVARRTTTAYDGGTGIRVAYRGQGLAHLLIDEAIKHTAKRGCTSFVLEVLDTNERAKKLYEKHGFATIRTLACHRRERPTPLREGTLKLEQQSELCLGRGECQPSWQYSEQSLKAGSYTGFAIVCNRETVGTLCLDTKRGMIAQIFIEPNQRRRGYAKEALLAAQALCESDHLSFYNVDTACLDLQGFLAAVGFHCVLTQSEMHRSLIPQARA